ncbi:MAG: TraM recognition domain-containing protein [Coxiellaceae bacterium]|nr:TraM recognition domain-containing protein [Coxiellaceae bacterium]
MAFQRGLSEHQEQNQAHIIRDTRPLSVRIADTLKNPRYTAVVLACFMVITYFLDYLSEIFLIAGIISFIYCFTRKSSLPFRLPKRAKRKDYNDLAPGTKNPRESRGIYFFGNENRSNEELWFSNEDMRTHVLIFGSTGSGKTEFLVSMAYNALLQASGFIYVDGKGDNGLFSKVFSMVRSMGREDDMLLINFMTGARDIIGPQEKRLSNTLNPFANGSSSMLANLIVSLMDSSSASADGDMWKGRAIGFVEALMKVLVAMRDAGHILLDANTIRNYFLLPKLEAMVVDKLFVRDGQESVSLENLPPNVLEPINNYVFNLPGYNREKKGKQVSQVLEQHGFITMQLTRAFTSLADTYGHILRTNLAEVDLSDVVLNRRILCVLLPALEKSPDELSNLGKVIIATLKAMMAAGLGDSVEGEYEDLIESKPTNADTPFLCILDEYGYYAVEGFAVVPAQARSLGFSVVFAGQDLPAFQKASKEEAASIGANTNIKICMKLEDPTETWDFFMKGAGESYVTQVESFQVDQGSVLGNYQDGKGARVEKRARIDLLDLKEQSMGEAHFFFRSKIVRGRVFYANPKVVKRMRLNHFLKVDEPEDEEREMLVKSFNQFEQLANGGVVFQDETMVSEDIDGIVNLLQTHSNLSPIDRSLMAMTQMNQKMGYGVAESFGGEEAIFDIPGMDELDMDIDHLNIFTPMRHAEHLEGLIMTDDVKQFSKPLLDRAHSRDQVEYIQRLCGKTGQQAMNIAIEVVGDMERGTQYPPDYKPEMAGGEMARLVDGLCDVIDLKKREEANKTDS